MVILIQLLLFCLAMAIRGRSWSGKHLRVVKGSAIDQGHLEGIYKGKYGNLQSVYIGLKQKQGTPFIIQKERWHHRFLKSMGIAYEIKIADALFDAKYFVTTDYPQHLEQLLALSDLLQQLKELFALPVKSLHATTDKIWCAIDRSDLVEDRAHYAKHIEILKRISQTTNQLAVRNSNSMSGNLALLFICVHAGLLTLGLFGMFPFFIDSIDILNESEWIIKGILGGLVAGVLWFFLVVRVLKQSSWVCWVLFDFVVCGIVGFLLSGVILMRDLSIWLPQSDPRIVTQSVVKRECVLQCREHCGRNCTNWISFNFSDTSACMPASRVQIMAEKKRANPICQSSAWYEYNISTPHWEKQEDYNFDASSTLFDSITIGSLVHIPINEGVFGIKWIDTDMIRLKK